MTRGYANFTPGTFQGSSILGFSFGVCTQNVGNKFEQRDRSKRPLFDLDLPKVDTPKVGNKFELRDRSKQPLFDFPKVSGAQQFKKATRNPFHKDKKIVHTQRPEEEEQKTEEQKKEMAPAPPRSPKAVLPEIPATANDAPKGRRHVRVPVERMLAAGIVPTVLSFDAPDNAAESIISFEKVEEDDNEDLTAEDWLLC